ncbi:MAG: hypothetical protein KGZ71_01630 [Desulfobulbaceae bacterium]|nr:hypothetical protein [Desulfobulbaceae bacterium]
MAINDHYVGDYLGEPEKEKAANSKTKAAKYRLKRKHFEDSLSTLSPSEAINLVNKEYDENYEILRKRYPKRFKAFNKNEAFNDDEYLVIYKNEELLLCSYLYFLHKLKQFKNYSLINEKTNTQLEHAEIIKNDLIIKNITIDKNFKPKLTGEEIGMLIHILVKYKFIGKLGDNSLGKIGYALTGLSDTNIKKPIAHKQFEESASNYNGERSTHHLEMILGVVSELSEIIKQLISEQK